jgi:hypothetical protein
LDAPWLEARYMNTEIKTLETSTPVITKQKQKPDQQQTQKQQQNKVSSKRSNNDLQPPGNKKAKK